MKVTTKELAGRARVLTAAICRALMNDPKVRPKVRDLILSLFSQLEHKPTNILAGNFNRKKTNITGIALPEAADRFFNELILDGISTGILVPVSPAIS